jgi:hypothetical protein
MVRSIRRKSEAPSGERSALRLQCDGFRLKTGERMHPHAAQSSTRRGSLGSGPHSPAAHVAACDGRAAGARAHRSGAPSGQRRSPRHALRRPGGGRRRVWPHAATSRSALSAMARQTLPLASRWTMRSPPSRTVTSQPQVAGAGSAARSRFGSHSSIAPSTCSPVAETGQTGSATCAWSRARSFRLAIVP